MRLWFALVFAGACAHPDALFLHGGAIWTGDPAHPRASAVLVERGKIVAVGADREVEQQTPRGARRIALGGRVVLPGFEDAHFHILSGGLALAGLDLSTDRSRAEILRHVAEWTRAHPELPWIVGRGWSYDAFTPALPTAAELDAVVGDRPVFLSSYDGHSAWVSTRALALAGVGATTPDPPGGTIVRLAGTRTPAGALLEHARELVEARLPAPSVSEKRSAILRALALAASLGVTAVGEVGGSLEDLAIYEQLARELRLPIRVVYGPAIEEGAAAYAKRARALGAGLLTAGPQKGFIDGVIESNTAQLRTPYADGSGAGAAPHLRVEDIEQQLRAARAEGLDVAYHAVGDGAVHAVLDAVERLGPSSTSRTRIEHVEILDPEDLPRFARLRVVASVMPIHADPTAEVGTAGEVGVWSKKVGPARLRYAFPLASLHQEGVRLAFGSDWPVAAIDPLRAIAIAVTRQSADGHPDGGWIAAQRIDLPTALHAYTAGSAYAMRLEDRTGVLRPGLAADLVVLDPSVELTNPRTLHRARVELTLVAGQLVWDPANLGTSARKRARSMQK